MNPLSDLPKIFAVELIYTTEIFLAWFKYSKLRRLTFWVPPGKGEFSS